MKLSLTSSLSTISKRQIMVAIASIMLLIAVPLTSYINYKGVKEKDSAYITSSKYPTGELTTLLLTQPLIVVITSIIAFNTNSMKLDLNFVPIPVQNPLFPNISDFQFLVDTKSAQFTLRDIIPQISFPVTTYQATPNNYPFDFYSVNVTVRAKQTSTLSPLPVGIGFAGGMTGWTVHVDMYDVKDNVQLAISLYRSPTIILFSLFIMTIMWALSITVMILSLSVWYRDRKIEPPTIAFTGSLLFALPAIRNIQPGAPQIGCIADTASFFWCMGLVVISMLMNMWNYIEKNPREY
ncbi:hypothetical protein BC833DRAFT_603555 [Globomyces pollinis-pini]|nr:hypothetical protein BC833DRAFT_603555 [Globomyces pollinis-pini]